MATNSNAASNPNTLEVKKLQLPKFMPLKISGEVQVALGVAYEIVRGFFYNVGYLDPKAASKWKHIQQNKDHGSPLSDWDKEFEGLLNKSPYVYDIALDLIQQSLSQCDNLYVVLDLLDGNDGFSNMANGNRSKRKDAPKIYLNAPAAFHAMLDELVKKAETDLHKKEEQAKKYETERQRCREKEEADRAKGVDSTKRQKIASARKLLNDAGFSVTKKK